MFVVKSRSGVYVLSSKAASAARALEIIREHQRMGLSGTVCLRDDDFSRIIVISEQQLETLAAGEPCDA